MNLIEDRMERLLEEAAMSEDPEWTRRILKALKSGYAEGGIFGLMDAAYELQLKAPQRLLGRILKGVGKRGELDGNPVTSAELQKQNLLKFAEKLLALPEPAYA